MQINNNLITMLSQLIMNIIGGINLVLINFLLNFAV